MIITFFVFVFIKKIGPAIKKKGSSNVEPFEYIKKVK